MQLKQNERGGFVNTEEVNPHLTAKIVVSYVRHHRLVPDQLADLIRRFRAKPDKKIVDGQAASPSSWKTTATAFAAAPICGHDRGPQLVVMRSP